MALRNGTQACGRGLLVGAVVGLLANPFISPTPVHAGDGKAPTQGSEPQSDGGSPVSRGANAARSVEMQARCAAGDVVGFVYMLARYAHLRQQRIGSFVRRIDDTSDTVVRRADYADFPLEILESNLIRRGSGTGPEEPQHLLVRSARGADGEAYVYWFRAIYDDEPMGEAPGTLLSAVGPRGLLAFEIAADGCWSLSRDIRGERALWAFFDGSEETGSGPD